MYHIWSEENLANSAYVSYVIKWNNFFDVQTIWMKLGM